MFIKRLLCHAAGGLFLTQLTQCWFDITIVILKDAATAAIRRSSRMQHPSEGTLPQVPIAGVNLGQIPGWASDCCGYIYTRALVQRLELVLTWKGRHQRYY